MSYAWKTSKEISMETKIQAPDPLKTPFDPADPDLPINPIPRDDEQQKTTFPPTKEHPF
jgi:hypothetical protein